MCFTEREKFIRLNSIRFDGDSEWRKLELYCAWGVFVFSLCWTDSRRGIPSRKRYPIRAGIVDVQRGHIVDVDTRTRGVKAWT